MPTANPVKGKDLRNPRPDTLAWTDCPNLLMRLVYRRIVRFVGQQL